ncbi:MAG TPA: amidohydrolase family protein [Gemmatimonadaceae bacterium]|jgi:aminocarboxymuconate-semialdehyde decarboxylase|nr:amidohydrolase family protein [Gemmatimonadaceae bacterium]
MLIDVHNHFYPPEYLAALESGDSAVKVTIDAEGNPCIHYPGDYNVAVRGHRDIAYRQSVLEKEGVDTQVITLTTPGTHVETPATAARLARLVNDAFARVIAERSPRFAALATLPLNDVQASIAELKRAMTELRLPGAMVFSNVNGVALADKRYEPLWAEANRLEAIIHIHPTDPVGVEAMTDYWLMPLVGFLADTTLAAAKLVFAGVPDRYPNIKWVLGHLGGAIPYLAERLDRGWEAFPDCRADIQHKPTEYLRRFYYDGVNFDPRAVRLAVDFAGADHVMAASDYPHQIGSIPKMKSSLAALDVSDEERKKIMGENARKLYRL